MAAPALAAAGQFVASNPWIIPTATSAISALYRAITPDRQAELRDDVLNSQLQFRNMMARRAFGDFTAADQQQIMQASEPQVNMIASNVARRGLGGSGAGAQVIAEAQQRPFFEAQRQAQQTLPILDAQITQATQALMGDGSFFEDLQATAALIAEELKTDPDATNDPDLQHQITWLWNLLGKPMPKTPENAATSQFNPFLKPGATLDEAFGR